MAEELFDYTKYFRPMAANAEINIDVSGLDVKSSASSESMNDDGTVDDIGMNEYVTNNVKYIITRITGTGQTVNPMNVLKISAYTYANNNVGYAMESCYTGLNYSFDDLASIGVELPAQYNKVSSVEISLIDGNPSTSSTVRESLASQLSADPSLTLYSVTLFNNSENPSTLIPSSTTLSGKIKFFLTPRYELMADSQNCLFTPDDNYALFLQAYAGLGFYGRQYIGLDTLKKLMSSDPKIRWDYKKFKKRVNYISNIANENDLGLDVTYYDDHYAAELPDSIEDATKSDYKANRTKAVTKHLSYLNAKQECDYTNTYSWCKDNQITQNAVCSSLSGYYNAWLKHTSDFIAQYNKKTDIPRELSTTLVDDISETNYGNGTALIPNVSDAFKQFFGDTDSMANEFTDKFNDVLKSLRNLSALLAMIPSKYRSKLNKFCGTLLKTNENSSGSASVAKNNRLLDLSLVTRYLYKDASYDKWKMTAKYAARAITEYGNTVYFVDDNNIPYTSTAKKPNSKYPKLKQAVYNGKTFTVDGTTVPYDSDDHSYDIVQTSVTRLVAKKGTSATCSEYSGTTYNNLATKSFIAYDTYKDTEIVDYLTSIFNDWYSNNVVADGCSAEWEWLDQYDSSDIETIAEFFPKYKEEVGKTGVQSDTVLFINTDSARNCYAMNEDRYMTKCTFTDSDNNTTEVLVIMACTSSKGTRNRDAGSTFMIISKEDEKNPKYTMDTGIPSSLSDIINSSITLGSFLANVLPMLNFVRDGSVGDTGNGWSNYRASGDYNVIQWSTGTTPGSVTNYCCNDMPAYQVLENFSDGDIDVNYLAQNAMSIFGDVIEAMDTAIAAMAVVSPGVAITQKVKLSSVKDDFSDLKALIKKILYYELYTNESVFNNKSFIVSSDYDVTRRSLDDFTFYHMPARFMLPVKMYKKVRKRYKSWGRTRHKMVNQSIGIRWVEVRYIDTSVYGEYPQNDTIPMNEVVLDADADVSVSSDGTITLDFGSDLEVTNNTLKVGDYTYSKQGIVHLCSQKKGFESEYYYTVRIKDGQTLVSDSSSGGDDTDSWMYSPTDMTIDAEGSDAQKVKKLSKVHVWGLQLPLAPTQGNDDLSKVRIMYNMPYIPYDDEIRNKAFVDYGPFDQSKYAMQSRTDADLDRIDGWKVFYHSSKRIQDMRKGLGIYEALSMLVSILKNTFGEKRVKLCETRRSMEDEASICSGSSESEFLSWHNYGLSAKIVITKDDLHTAITEDDDEFLTLIDVAEAFTEGCRTAKLCPYPLNIVWCGRLVMGADNFVWEFLPIGVNHKDAPKFRESLLQQRDPVMEFGYINVDSEGLAVDTVPEDTSSYYILKSSDAYKNAVVINGEHYVDPYKIRNYVFPSDLLLINIIEYVHMLQLKMAAHGSTLTERANMYDWKALNETSYRQLVQLFGMSGNYSSARSLIAGDYVEKYQMYVDQFFATDQVEFVKEMLGDAYESVKIYITDIGDGGAYLMLHDGKLHMKVTDIRPTYNMNSKEHFFGQQQINPNSVERGRWIGGVFYNVVEIAVLTDVELEYVSEDPVISGYSSDGTVTGGDALLLHSILATQIKNKFDELRKMFEEYSGSLMYDHFEDGPNANMTDMLENEFGIISSQDLMEFDALRNMVNRNNINANADVASDGTVLGAGTDEESRLNDETKPDGSYWESIYEKVVSNAQLSGIRKASLTKEHVTETVESTPLSVEQLYKIVQQGRGFTANDIIK